PLHIFGRFKIEAFRPFIPGIAIDSAHGGSINLWVPLLRPLHIELATRRVIGAACNEFLAMLVDPIHRLLGVVTIGLGSDELGREHFLVGIWLQFETRIVALVELDRAQAASGA